MFERQKLNKKYEKIHYKSAPKRYKSKPSRKMKEFYTRGYKKPKSKPVDQVNFKIPHEGLKPKKPQKEYQFKDISRKARAELYTYKEKKPTRDDASGIRFRKTRGVGPLYKGNAVNDQVKHNDAQSKLRRKLERLRIFYLVVTVFGLLGLFTSIYFRVVFPMIMFMILTLFALYNWYTCHD